MQDSKPWYLSSSIFGSLLVVVSAALSIAKIDLGDTPAFANDIVALVGAAIAVYGRVKAVKKIG
jgi:hypothetical protein